MSPLTLAITSAITFGLGTMYSKASAPEKVVFTVLYGLVIFGVATILEFKILERLVSFLK